MWLFTLKSPVFRDTENGKKITEFGKNTEITEFHENTLFDAKTIKNQNTLSKQIIKTKQKPIKQNFAWA